MPSRVVKSRLESRAQVSRAIRNLSTQSTVPRPERRKNSCAISRKTTGQRLPFRATIEINRLSARSGKDLFSGIHGEHRSKTVAHPDQAALHFAGK